MDGLIDLQRDGAPAHLSDLAGYRLRLLDPEIDAHYVRTLGREGQRDRPADAPRPRGSGDERDSSRQSEVHDCSAPR